MVDWVVSGSDVRDHPMYNNGKSVEAILASYGMDIKAGYTIDLRGLEEQPDDWPKGEEFFAFTHRSPFTGRITSSEIYRGQARQDGKWKRFVSDFLELPAQL